MSQFAYDDEPCPSRGPGLNHITDGTPQCAECGITCYNARLRTETPTEPSPAPSPWQVPSPRRPFNPVPNYLKSEYYRERRHLSDKDAQAFVAFQHGLEPAVGCQPWTLRELARLEFLAWRVARETP